MASPTELVEKVLDKVNAPVLKVPPDVDEKLKRGQERQKQVSPRRRVSIEFANNEHYVSLGRQNNVVRLDTVPLAQGGEKPDHRVRISRDLISPIVKAKVSATTQRVPSYESVTTSQDAEDWAAAALAEKIAVAGYDLWHLKRHNKKLVWNALVTEEGFIRPFWDATVGPFIEDPATGQSVGLGEVAFRVYSGLEVGWEQGVDYEESSWCYIEHARPVEEVEREAGFQGKKLDPDAEGSELPKERKGSKLVMVTEFLERPCPEYPEGRRLIIANGRQIFPEDTYPLRDHEENVIDEPCLHRIAYELDGGSDRDRGLVPKLIESMRAYDQAGNKFLEWVQLALTPQLMAEEGTLAEDFVSDDTPGALVEYRPEINGKEPKWRDVPPIPPELERQQERSKQEMEWIAHDVEITNPNSAKEINALAQKNALAWQDFLEDYAELQGRVMRDALTLVQLHYTDDRLLKFRGRTGWEKVPEFRGADIRGQTDIRVSPSSLEPRTKASNEQRIMNIAQMFPGHFPPEVIISALEGGSAEKLIEGYEDDVSNANWIISMIRSGQFWTIPQRPVFPGEEAPEINPLTGLPEMEEVGPEQFIPKMITELPGWMPRPFENVPVYEAVLTTWMKTEDWRNLDEAAQRATMDVYLGLQEIKAKKAAQDAQLQASMAESQGMTNATRTPTKPLPSLPSLNQGEGT